MCAVASRGTHIKNMKRVVSFEGTAKNSFFTVEFK